MRLSPFVFAFALAFPVTLSAETREERLAAAQTYVDATLANIDMDAMIATMWLPVVQQVEASGATVTQGQRDELQALYMAEFEQPMLDIMKAQSGVMADIMSLDEITAMRDFNATPEGRSVMMKLPQVMAAQQPMIMSLMTDVMPSVMPKVQAIFQP